MTQIDLPVRATALRRSHRVGRLRRLLAFLAVASCAALPVGAACGGTPERDERAEAQEPALGQPAGGAASALADALARAHEVEQLLLPAPILTPAEEAALRSASNDQQLARARQLGVRVADSAAVEALVRDGRLVRLEDSTGFWVTRELRSSLPYLTPAARALLVQIGERFQQRLERMGLPRYRVEVTSVLRTAADQSALRETNSNAAAGVSTHEFGTSMDVAYSGYAAPLADSGQPADDAEALAERITALALERVAARYSRELQKVLGDVLRELQSEGLVMVTLERQQPVYHLTLARAPGG